MALGPKSSYPFEHKRIFKKLDDNFHQEAGQNFEFEKFNGWMSEVYNSGNSIRPGQLERLLAKLYT